MRLLISNLNKKKLLKKEKKEVKMDLGFKREKKIKGF